MTPPPTVSKDALIAGKYKIINEIGRGGMVVIYKAEDIRLKRTVLGALRAQAPSASTPATITPAESSV